MGGRSRVRSARGSGGAGPLPDGAGSRLWTTADLPCPKVGGRSRVWSARGSGGVGPLPNGVGSRLDLTADLPCPKVGGHIFRAFVSHLTNAGMERSWDCEMNLVSLTWLMSILCEFFI